MQCPTQENLLMILKSLDRSRFYAALTSYMNEILQNRLSPGIENQPIP